jgi:hypothetical protein
MALRVLRQDAVAIWRSSGVTIVWVSERSGTESASGGAPDLIAILLRAGDGDRPARRAALASLDFLDGVPDRRIRVFVDRAQRLLASARSADGVAGLADSDIALGRVLGRVLAHEVGHYVLATTRHTPSGLMQATHAINMLARPDRRPFRLDGVSRARIALGWHAGVVATTADDCSLTAAWLGGR